MKKASYMGGTLRSIKDGLMDEGRNESNYSILVHRHNDIIMNAYYTDGDDIHLDDGMLGLSFNVSFVSIIFWA